MQQMRITNVISIFPMEIANGFDLNASVFRMLPHPTVRLDFGAISICCKNHACKYFFAGLLDCDEGIRLFLNFGFPPVVDEVTRGLVDDFCDLEAPICVGARHDNGRWGKFRFHFTLQFKMQGASPKLPEGEF